MWMHDMYVYVHVLFQYANAMNMYVKMEEPVRRYLVWKLKVLNAFASLVMTDFGVKVRR